MNSAFIWQSMLLRVRLIMRLVEAMEAAGVVSSMDASGGREVLAPGGPE